MSAFEKILQDLVREDGAAGAIFVDDSGETVDLATSEGGDEMRLIGAYAGIYLRQARRFSANEGLGDVSMILIRCRGLQLQVLRLREGYSLILVRREPYIEALSRYRMERAGQAIEREAFAGG